MRAKLHALVIVLVVVVVAAPARAEQAEVRTAVVLRERSDENARVVERVAAGTKVTLVARRIDGAWLLVRTARHEGWAQKGFFELSSAAAPATAATANAGSGEPPLAPPIGARAQAAAAPQARPSAPAPQPHVDGWVSQSTYYKKRRLDAVTLQPCEVHARTDEESHVVTALEKGRALVLVRLSADEAWGLVRFDGAELGWVSMAAVRVRGVASDAGAPPDASGAPASLARSDGDAASPTAELHAVARPPEHADGLVVGAGAGIAVLSRRLVSNGLQPMAAYELSTTAAATVVSADFAHRLGRYALLGVDASYAYAGGARVQWHAADGSQVSARMQLHDAEAGLRLGLHARAAGGLDVWLRGGAELTVTILDPDANVRLASDRLIAPTVGLGFAAPRLIALGSHWLGVGIYGRALVLGQRTENLSEGAQRGTWGGNFGGSVSLELWHAAHRGELLASAAYSYRFSVSRYAGPSVRDPSATQSTLGCVEQLATLALAWAY
ncbi:MAG: hypothetical protein ACXVDD_05115 [Polyangia bacterium]